MTEKAATAATLIMLLDSSQAFTSSFFSPSKLAMHRSPSSSSTAVPTTTVTMDCSPWDLECYGVDPFGRERGRGRGGRGGRGGGGGRKRGMQRYRPSFGPMIFAPSEGQPNQHLRVGDPVIILETDDLYALAFDLPAGVDHDGLDVSVSDRLLTVKASITREQEADPFTTRGGWVTRSSRVDSVSRSFVLPEGLVESSATASLAESKAEVRFNKDKSVRGEAASTAAPPVTPSTTGTVASAGDTTAAPASSADAGRTPLTDSTGSTPAAGPSAAAASSSASSPADAASTPAASTEPRPSRPASPFEAVDQEFREFAKAMWGEDVLERLQVPTQEELAEQAAMAREAWAKREAEFEERARAAKEARAKRVLAMRRATMAADISLSEDGSSYVVRFALPEGTTREDVKLTVNPSKSIRVAVSATSTAAAGGGGGGGGPDRSVYKDVALPKDAILSEISAKFEAEQHPDEKGNAEEGGEKATAGGGGATKEGAVAGVEVTVGKASPPQPKNVEIL
ncbi:expressed unknown protein [Ectocarpus siliculosus]|uniref:SHSP domain-containing protein n=1 Tax=Ectocarpus siliculosus TaxID=2880 RepID=D8LP10_ECTSI|nr:expressed unknown protein [Ectocarpus siliculosus]|eukprot:CBN80281.1 expressed unknown protein [Ectocarpus siliculosus]